MQSHMKENAGCSQAANLALQIIGRTCHHHHQLIYCLLGYQGIITSHQS